jgi:hypothetical protein
MNSARSSNNFACARALLFSVGLVVAPALGSAHETGGQHVHFQKPTQAEAANKNSLQFRSSSQANAPETARSEAKQAAPSTFQQIAAKPVATPAAPTVQQAIRQAPAKSAAQPAFMNPADEVTELMNYRVDHSTVRGRIRTAEHVEPVFSAPSKKSGLQLTGFFDSCVDCAEPACGLVEPTCGCGEPTCGICEPGCGIEEPGCGIVEPGCGVVEPGCGLLEPTCGCDEPECGSCVGRPGPDYWCFPVCLPRFKELNVWAGVHGFKGPRDSPPLGGSADNNFGFQEGVNLGGRAPLVGLLFPQLSYQLGYQAVQSQLSGRSDGSEEDRLQQFVTAGLFRRVPAGLQFGAVWDMLRDDFIDEVDFHQVRYEISIKGQSGLELGFWGATHSNDETITVTSPSIQDINFQSVDQYNLFARYHFRGGSEARFWGGATNDSEGIFGGDFYTPFNDRWSLQSGFNYLIPEQGPGLLGSQQESWNVGMNLVWHYGFTAKKSRTNPHRPLFSTADNGTMFIDERP